jgi:hypothetical protein
MNTKERSECWWMTLQLNLYFYTYDERALTGLIWLRTQLNVRLFRIGQPNVRFHNPLAPEFSFKF